MAANMKTLEGVQGFERVDIGELYYIGSRQFVEAGLSYYRNFAVEALSWDGDAHCVRATVAESFSSSYEVSLRLNDGRIEHDCCCSAWRTRSGCAHVVAALAAVFLAVQGKSIGGQEMPSDYAQDLRRQLGYRDVGGAVAEGPGDEAEIGSELWLTAVREYGHLDFQIHGEVPHAFLRSVGIALPNHYGFSVAREFSLVSAQTSLAKFLSTAKAEQIPVLFGVDGEQRTLQMSRATCRMRRVYDYSEEQVSRRLRFEGAKGVVLEAYCLIPGSQYVILTDGSVRRVQSEGDALPGDAGALQMVTDAETFNEEAYARNFTAMAARSGNCAFSIAGAAQSPVELDAAAVRIEIDLSAVENAAGEREALEFELYARADGVRLDLYAFQSALMGTVLSGTFGSLLNAKRRVRALCDLLRRVLSANESGKRLDLHTMAASFPELFSAEYGSVVRGVVDKLVNYIGASRVDEQRLVLDDVNERWLACPLHLGKVAMLLWSMSDAATRDDLKGLSSGSLHLSRNDCGDAALQRLVSVCAALGVRVRYNNQQIRTAPLSINLQGKHGGAGKDIDWFELHPSMSCGDRTISPAEWKRLIRGQLFLEAEDGSLIMPEVGEGQADGLQMIAEVLQRGQSRLSDAGLAGDGGLQISRLEMLDWIALRRKGVQLQLPEAVEAVFTSLSQFDQLQEFVPPQLLQAELRPYQREGCAWIEFLYQHRFGACLADDMGLGKTVQAIAFLVARFEQQLAAQQQASVLVVLPPSLVFNWLDEFARFAPHLRVCDCLNHAQWSSALEEAQVVLTTYDRVRIDAKNMAAHEFDIVVFDEAHNLKNVSTARTKAAAQLNRRFTLCLTGTPVENNVSEFYSVLTATVPGIFGALKDFKESYRREPQRTLRRAAPFVLRRTKEKILKELPKKEEHELFLEMSPIQKEMYTRTVSEVREEVALAYEDRPDQQAGIIALAAILRLRQVCVSPALLGKSMSEPAPKFSHMADQLEELQAEGHAALVFSQFIGGLDQMQAIAEARNIPYLRMDGRTPVAKRKELVQRFQSGEGPAFFFISLKTGGVGLNLTRANYVFHLDPWWNPAVENQASDRAHRIGQTRSVFVQRLIMQHTIEARMLELKARKAELFRQLVEEPGGKPASAALSRHDFEYLLNG
jgi:superfamily II DNA or RNA helicase